VHLVWILVGILVLLIVATGVYDATRTRRRAAALRRALAQLDEEDEKDEEGGPDDPAGRPPTDRPPA
jgi:hypothetical protein